MSGLLIIPLLVSGYVFLFTHPLHFYKLHRYDGWLLYMKASLYGLLCVVLSFFIAIVVKMLFPHIHFVSYIASKIKFDKYDVDSRLHSWLVLTSILSVFVGWFLGLFAHARCFYKFCNKTKIFDSGLSLSGVKDAFRVSMLTPIFSDSPVDSMLFQSLIEKRRVLLTLKCGKVYVGVIHKISEPNEKSEPNRQISFIPVMSGYREVTNKRVVFLNDYSKLKGVDTSVAIPKDEVCRISWYTQEVHNTVDCSDFEVLQTRSVNVVLRHSQ